MRYDGGKMVIMCLIYAARHYSSPVYAVVMCPSVWWSRLLYNIFLLLSMHFSKWRWTNYKSNLAFWLSHIFVTRLL